MKNIINKTIIAISALAMAFTTSCTKVDGDMQQYLDVNASNLHGNWQLVLFNGEELKDGSSFYINFNRSGQKYKIWNGMESIPQSYDYSEGTFEIYTEPELGAYIRGIDNALVDWDDMYVIKNLTKTHMTWVGVNDPTFVQTFARVSKVPFAE